MAALQYHIGHLVYTLQGANYTPAVTCNDCDSLYSQRTRRARDVREGKGEMEGSFVVVQIVNEN